MLSFCALTKIFPTLEFKANLHNLSSKQTRIFKLCKYGHMNFDDGFRKKTNAASLFIKYQFLLIAGHAADKHKILL